MKLERAVPVLRRRRPSVRGWTVHASRRTLAPLLAAALSLWLLSGLTPGQALAGAVALASGVALYAPGTRTRRA